MESWDSGTAADGDPWAVATPGPEAIANGTPLRGLTWDMLRDVLASPSRSHRIILGLACLLVDEDKETTTVQAAAMRLKTTEVGLLEAVSRMPNLFRLVRNGHGIALVVPGRDPAEKTPRQIAAEVKEKASARKAEAKSAVDDAADAEQTPINTCRLALEGLGMARADARGFARFLGSTYGTEASLLAIAEARVSKPIDPKSWIAAALKRRLTGSNRPMQRAKRILPFIRPGGSRETQFIGWTDREPRQKLYRLPEGRIKEVPPEPGDVIPSFDEDPGCTVA